MWYAPPCICWSDIFEPCDPLKRVPECKLERLLYFERTYMDKNEHWKTRSIHWSVDIQEKTVLVLRNLKTEELNCLETRDGLLGRIEDHTSVGFWRFRLLPAQAANWGLGKAYAGFVLVAAYRFERISARLVTL